jgi:hypothetical protein
MVCDLETTLNRPRSILQSNATKLTPDGAPIDVLARREDNSALMSVGDMSIAFNFSTPIQT